MTTRKINYPATFAGAAIMGGIVLMVNIDHGWLPALTAALKQAGYTLLFGGAIIRLLEYLVERLHVNRFSVIIPAVLVSVLTISLVYLVHSLKGTPKPFESTLPTILLAPPGFFYLAKKKRKQFQSKSQSE